MHSPASKLGRRTTPSLKKLIAVMAGFLGAFVVLAELASATTNRQPTIAPVPAATPATTTQRPEPAVEQQTASVLEPEPQLDSLTYGVNEVIKMYRGGVKADVLLTYIETSNFPYQLSSKEILYLNKIGVPSVIVNAMIKRDHQVQVAKTDAGQVETTPVTPPLPVAYGQPAVVVVQQPVAHVSRSACTTTACAAPNPNVTVIGSRYGSTFRNGCYYGPFDCSPARAYYNSEFGPLCRPSFYDIGCGPSFAYGGFGRFGYGHRGGRY